MVSQGAEAKGRRFTIPSCTRNAVLGRAGIALVRKLRRSGAALYFKRRPGALPLQECLAALPELPAAVLPGLSEDVQCGAHT